MNTRIKKSKSVNQYNLKGEYLNTFTSIPDALDYMNVRRNSGISRCCRGLARSYNGYLWRYSDEVIKGDNIASYKRSDTVSVVKLTLTGDLIEIFDTVKLAELSVNGTVNIAKCCNGDYEQSKGYKWMYLEDYIKLRS